MTPEHLGELLRLRHMWLEVGLTEPEVDEYVIRDADYLTNVSDSEYLDTALQSSPEADRYDRTPLGLLQIVLGHEKFYLHLYSARDQSRIARYLWHELTEEEQRPFRDYSRTVKSRGRQQVLPWRDPTYVLVLPRLLRYRVPPPRLAVPYLRVLRELYESGPQHVTVGLGERQWEITVPVRATDEIIDGQRALRGRDLESILAGRWQGPLPEFECYARPRDADGREVLPD